MVTVPYSPLLQRLHSVKSERSDGMRRQLQSMSSGNKRCRTAAIIEADNEASETASSSGSSSGSAVTITFGDCAENHAGAVHASGTCAVCA